MPACQIQKVYTTPLHICIAIRVPGKTRWWWIGRGKPNNQIIVNEQVPPPKFRGKDASVEWLRSRLKGRWLSHILYDEKRGILRFTEADEDSFLEFGYIEGRLHHREGSLGSETKTWIIRRSDQQHTNELAGPDEYIPFDESEFDLTLDPLERLNNWYEKNDKNIQKRIDKKKKNKIKNIEKDIEKLSKHQDLYSIAADHQALANQEVVELKEIKIKFKKNQTVYQKADQIYEKGKRFKSALSLQHKRLEEAQDKLKKNPNIQSFEIKPDSLHWILPGAKKTIAVKNNNKFGPKYETFSLSSGALIAIGLDAQSNDYLRKEWANKDDLWVHIESEPGSHLFYRSKQVPDQDTWELIGSVLRDYSKITFTMVSLIWTQVRYLRAVKGQAGLIRFTKEKRITINYNDQWRNLLALR